MKRKTKVLSLILAVVVISASLPIFTLVSSAADADTALQLGIDSSNSNGVTSVATDPLGTDDVLSLKVKSSNRYSYGIADDCVPFVLTQGHTYTVTFDAYYYIEGEAVRPINIQLYRTTETGGKKTGNKDSIKNAGIYLNAANEWQSVEMTFTADLTSYSERKYLLLTVYISGESSGINPENIYIKNLTVSDLSMPENVTDIEIDLSLTKTDYCIGDAMSPKDITVKVTYDDGGQETVTEGYYILSGFDTSTAGTFEVTVTYGRATDRFTITVREPVVYLSDSNLELTKGASVKLTASTSPSGRSVIWESSDTSVAEVSPDGTVKAAAAGTAEVSAYVLCDGIKYGSACTVKVTETGVDWNEPLLVINSTTAPRNGEFTVLASLKNTGLLRNVGISNIEYDKNVIELVSVKWLVKDALLSDWDDENNKGAVVFGDNTDINGVLLQLTFRIVGEVDGVETQVSCDVKAKTIVDGADTELTVSVIPSTITFRQLQGDVDENGVVDGDDAIYLLYFTLFGNEHYPLNQYCDFNGDMSVTSDDAVYLLYHTLFGDEYPLPENRDSFADITTGDDIVDKDDGFGEWIPIIR